MKVIHEYLLRLDPILWRLDAKMYLIRILTSRSLKVKPSSMAEFAIYNFLLVSNSNQGSMSNGLSGIEE